MLRHELVSEAQGLIEDPVFWDATKLTTLFNRGMRDVSNAMGVAASGYFIFESVTGQQQYQIPYDFLAHETLSFTADGIDNIIHIKPRPRSIVGLVSDRTDQGTPTRGFFWAKEDREELWIHPTFDTNGQQVEWFYWRRPPNIVADNDEPLIPRSWHTYLVDYAINWTNQQDQEKGWSYPLFIQWWASQKREIQASHTMAAVAQDDIRFGIFDHQLPRITGMHTPHFHVPDNWG